MDKLLVDTGRAAKLLQVAWREVELAATKDKLKDGQLAPRLLQAIRDSMASRTKTYVYVLPTQILAKLTLPALDARCLQAKRGGPGAFDARSVCHGVVVPFDKSHENVLGGSAEPYVNNPLRVPEITKRYRSAQKDKEGWDNLSYVAGEVERKNTPEFTRRVLRQVLVEVYRRLELTCVTYPAPSRASHRRTLDVISTFLSEKSGGDRALAVAHALLATVKSETSLFSEVRRARVTASDKASGMISDIECYAKNEELVLAVEVKDQQLTLTHVQDKLKNARAKGVRELLFIVQQSVAESERPSIDHLVEKEFASGHNVYILDLHRLAEGLLALFGERGRTHFLREVGSSLDAYALSVQHRRRWAELLREM